MPLSRFKYSIRIAVDFILLNVVAIPILLFYLIGVPFERGLYCDDDSIKYPYHDSTISSLVVYLIGTIIPVTVIGITEYFRVKNATVEKQATFFNREVHPWLWSFYSSVGVFLFGCACSHLLVDIAKYSVGRLRPHFLDICKPDWTKINCTVQKYIYPIPCLAPPSHRLKEARLSFPSGHASFSSFTMVYFVIYLQRRFHLKIAKLIKPVIQYSCLLFTFYTSLTRISDYKHHWSDVLAGFSNGALTAIIISYYVSDLFKTPSKMKFVLQDYQGSNVENPQ